jgi:GST-like protein
MITLFGYDTVNTLKVVAMLEELQTEYVIKSINIHQGEQHREAFLAINPKAKVPVIIDDGGSGPNVMMAESVAILIYLSNKHDAFLPTGKQENARALEWLLYQASAMGPIFGQCEYWYRIAAVPNPDVLAHYQSVADAIIAHMDDHLSRNTYFAGDTFSIADIAHFAWMCRSHSAGLTFQSNVYVTQWYNRILARPAIARSMEVVSSLSPNVGGGKSSTTTNDKNNNHNPT